MLDKYDVGIISPLYTCFRIKNSSINRYLSWYFKTSKWYRYIYLNGDNGARGDRVSIKNVVFFDLPISIPQDLTECIEISRLLDLVQVKLTTLKEKINTLKKYKKGLSVLLIKQGIYCGKLADFVAVQEKTKLPSSYGNPHGLYPFFINNDENIEKYCDEYCFDGTYLILNTGGSASIKLYQGKFSVMSDCLVLKPKKNSIGLYYYLKSIEKKIDKVGFQGTGLRHLDQNWFFKQTIILPIIDENKLEKINLYLDAKTIILKKEIKILQKIKNYLLANLFI